MATRKRAKSTAEGPTFCANCGQPVEGMAAKRAANPSAAFCCECGTRLSAAGTCPNRGCPFFGTVPQCD